MSARDQTDPARVRGVDASSDYEYWCRQTSIYDVSHATKAFYAGWHARDPLVNRLETEVANLDLDLAAVWEKFGIPGVSLAEGLKRLGRPGLLSKSRSRV